MFQYDYIEDYDNPSESREYLELVKYAKDKIYDYYGNGAQFFPAMHLKLDKLEKLSPEEILDEASKKGLI